MLATQASNDHMSAVAAVHDAVGTVGPVACFRQVQKSYDGKTHVVSDLNLDVRPGEFLTLLGPSGSGKTTTLMMLAGFEEPSDGVIELNGRSLIGVPAYRRNIGMVFQNYALFPHMTVAENLAFPLRMRHVDREGQAKRVKDILEVVRLGDVASRRPSQLSGGQQQRIALARALIFEPRIVLMDEPLGALDKQLREHMQLEIRHLHERLGITIVYVTHDQSEALIMSDRVAVFAGGRIQQIAAPHALYERPANAFVANFIGDNNQLSGRVVAHKGGEYTIDCGDGLIMSAVSDQDHAFGAEVLVVFRPENAVLIHPQPPLPNRLEVTVVERNYLGDHMRLCCRLPNDIPVTMKISNKLSFSRLMPGAVMTVFWSGNDCQVLAKS